MRNDKIFLQRAIEIADSGIKDGGGPFGAVISLNNKIISEAYNKVVLNKDPTAHAEILSIRKAASFLKSHDLSECTLYASCEPCPMCLGAIYWAGIRKVIYSCDSNDASSIGFNDKAIYDEIALEPGLRKISFRMMLKDEGLEIFRKWEKFEDKIQY